MTTIGIVHPGDMGSAIGAALVGAGKDAAWASDGRSAATRERADEAGMTDSGTVQALAVRSDVLISICPPHAAVAVAEEVAGFDGLYLDANAISPATAAQVSMIVRKGGATYVDGGVIGRPPRTAGDMRLYLSGAEAKTVADLFAGTVVDARVLSGDPVDASALKMAYAAWTKGTSALVLTVTEAAKRLGVDEALFDEWKLSQPRASDQAGAAAKAAAEKGWRWVGEMQQIAETFEAVGVPGGFHRAAQEVYSERRRPAGQQH